MTLLSFKNDLKFDVALDINIIIATDYYGHPKSSNLYRIIVLGCFPRELPSAILVTSRENPTNLKLVLRLLHHGVTAGSDREPVSSPSKVIFTAQKANIMELIEN